MNAADIPAREVALIHLAQCRAILDLDADPWRRAWDGLTIGARRVLLALGDQAPTYYAGREWVDLPTRCRVAVKSGSRRALEILRALPA